MHVDRHIMRGYNYNNRGNISRDLPTFPSSLEKQKRSSSNESTVSTGHIKDILLSPMTACNSPTSVSEMNIIVPGLCTPQYSPPPSPPRGKKNDNVQLSCRVETSCRQQQCNGRKKAIYRNRTSPPHYGNKSIPKTRSTPSCSSAAAAALLNEENLLDRAASESWNDDESAYSYSSRDQLLHKNTHANFQQQQPHQLSTSYDCNYKYSQETAYEEFGVERKLIEMKTKKNQSSLTSPAKQPAEMYGKKKKKHWIRSRQSVSRRSQEDVSPRKHYLITGLKSSASLGSPSTLPPSGKSPAPVKDSAQPVRTGSAPPSYFRVDIKDGLHSSSSAGYYSAPIETELRPDRSLSQMGMEVTEDDYCIEGEYMARQIHHASGCNGNRRRNSKKLSEGVFSMKELTKGLSSLEGISRNKSCSPKVIKTKVLSALRRGGGGGNNDFASKGTTGKTVPQQIAISVTPATSEDTCDDSLSKNDMKLLYRWQLARCRNDFKQASFRGGTSCNASDDYAHIEAAITNRMSEDGMSITSSVGDRTVSVDNRRCRINRQVSI